MSNGELLAFEDLTRWCGRTRPSAVKKFLQDRGINYTLNADRQPITTRTQLNEAMKGRRTSGPNWPVSKQ